MTITDTDLVFYADGNLDSNRKHELLEAAGKDPSLKETLLALDASRLPYKAAFDTRPLPELPEHLRQDVRYWVSMTRDKTGTWELSNDKSSIASSAQVSKPFFGSWAQAAALALAVTLSAVAGHQLAGNGATETQLATIATDTQTSWVHRVHSYQSLYVNNTVKDITPDLEATAQRLETLASLSSLTAAIPDLSAVGYQFTRAQELGFEGQPLIQLIYTQDGKLPLALCFMPSSDQKDTPLRLMEHDRLHTADWINDGQRYVIVASESTDTLQALYELTRHSFDKT